jgi:hypothetical protein
MAQTETRPAAPTGLDEPDFIELPDATAPSGAAATQTSGTRPPESRRSTARRRSKQPSPPTIVVADETPDELTWQEWIARRCSGDEGAALGMSLVLHLLLMALLAIVIIGQARSGPIVTTVLPYDGDDNFVLSEPLDTELTEVEVDGGLEQFQLPDMLADESRPITDALFAGAGAGESEGIGAADVAAGVQRFVPKNAVRAGSFTAWTTPTFGHPDRGEYYTRRFGEPDPQPGDSPRPGQPYYITIQIKVPEGRRRFPIRDVTGTITGTDGYQQRLPEHTYVLDRDGKPTRPRGGSIPVIDGAVQFIVFVPGARDLVKDTIEVSSELLDEEQTLELVFQVPDTEPQERGID